jgi:hypothetical protein
MITNRLISYYLTDRNKIQKEHSLISNRKMIANGEHARIKIYTRMNVRLVPVPWGQKKTRDFLLGWCGINNYVISILTYYSFCYLFKGTLSAA